MRISLSLQHLDSLTAQRIGTSQEHLLYIVSQSSKKKEQCQEMKEKGIFWGYLKGIWQLSCTFQLISSLLLLLFFLHFFQLLPIG